MSDDIITQYYEHLYHITSNIKRFTEECDKFNRRREMAKHSSYNSENFVERLTEDEGKSLANKSNYEEQLAGLNKFTKDEWVNNSTILFNYTNEMAKWCVDTFGYAPYDMIIKKGRRLCIFHEPEDAVATKLRWDE